MDYTLSMRCLEGAANLQHDSHYSRERHRPFITDNFLESSSVQEFHDQKYDAVFILAKVGDAESVWM